MAEPRFGVIISNVGTAASPEPDDIREFLRQMLSDRYIVDVPRAVWMPVLHLAILPNRPQRTAPRYRSIWTEEGSPFTLTCYAQRDALAAELERRGHDIPVALGMRYGEPSMGGALDELAAQGVTHVIALPLFPQQANVTTVTCLTELRRQLAQRPGLRLIGTIPYYCERPDYLQALADSVSDVWTWKPGSRLLFTFHSTLVDDIERGDPYYYQTVATARGAAELLGIPEEGWDVSYQSRFDNRKWLRPPAEEVLARWADEGVRDVAVVAPVFTADCIETLIDCDVDQRACFLERYAQSHPGAEPASFTYVRTLGARPDHIAVLASLVEERLGQVESLCRYGDPDAEFPNPNSYCPANEGMCGHHGRRGRRKARGQGAQVPYGKSGAPAKAPAPGAQAAPGAGERRAPEGSGGAAPEGGPSAR